MNDDLGLRILKVECWIESEKARQELSKTFWTEVSLLFFGALIGAGFVGLIWHSL